MQLTRCFNFPSDTKEETPFLRRVYLTQKEVSYVQQKAQSIAELQLRRLTNPSGNHRGGQAAAPMGLSGEGLEILPLHRGILLHAANLQLFAFSGGQLSHDSDLRPLWLSLLLEGNGLRRMTPDTSESAGRIFRLFGVEDLAAWSAQWVSDPWKAYRLGLFPRAQDLLNAGQELKRERELRLRIRLASGLLDPTDGTAEIEAVAGRQGTLRISLLSSALASASKQGKTFPLDWAAELESWVAQTQEKGILAAEAPLGAQVINALNLVDLMQEKFDPIGSRLTDLLNTVTPQIPDPSRRAHIEGNAFYQQSILARKRGDRDGELNALMRAMELDRYFATLYSRTAQLLHDRNDPHAELFYEMALALSPLDFPTANDYGCWLSESGKSQKLLSWTLLCQALYPESTEGDAG